MRGCLVKIKATAVFSCDISRVHLLWVSLRVQNAWVNQRISICWPRQNYEIRAEQNTWGKRLGRSDAASQASSSCDLLSPDINGKISSKHKPEEFLHRAHNSLGAVVKWMWGVIHIFHFLSWLLSPQYCKSSEITVQIPTFFLFSPLFIQQTNKRRKQPAQ